jgi:hypothetical protein
MHSLRSALARAERFLFVQCQPARHVGMRAREVLTLMRAGGASRAGEGGTRACEAPTVDICAVGSLLDDPPLVRLVELGHNVRDGYASQPEHGARAEFFLKILGWGLVELGLAVRFAMPDTVFNSSFNGPRLAARRRTGMTREGHIGIFLLVRQSAHSISNRCSLADRRLGQTRTASGGPRYPCAWTVVQLIERFLNAWMQVRFAMPDTESGILLL